MPGAGHWRTAVRSTSSASSSCFRPYCGWAAEHAPARLVHVLIEAGQHHGAAGQVAITRRSARVAGMLPVEPAATIRRSGGAARHCAASSVSRRCRRSAGSSARSAARRRGQVAITARTSRLLPVLGQVVRHQAGERVERHALGLQLVEKRGQLLGQTQRMDHRPAGALEQPREQQLSARRDRRRQRPRARCRGAPRRHRLRRVAGCAATAAPGWRTGATSPPRANGRRAGSAAESEHRRAHAAPPWPRPAARPPAPRRTAPCGNGRHTRHGSHLPRSDLALRPRTRGGATMRAKPASCAAQVFQTLFPAGTGAHLRDPRVRRRALAQLDLEPVRRQGGAGALRPFDQPDLVRSRRRPSSSNSAASAMRYRSMCRITRSPKR